MPTLLPKRIRKKCQYTGNMNMKRIGITLLCAVMMTSSLNATVKQQVNNWLSPEAVTRAHKIWKFSILGTRKKVVIDGHQLARYLSVAGPLMLYWYDNNATENYKNSFKAVSGVSVLLNAIVGQYADALITAASVYDIESIPSINRSNSVKDYTRSALFHTYLFRNIAKIDSIMHNPYGISPVWLEG